MSAQPVFERHVPGDRPLTAVALDGGSYAEAWSASGEQSLALDPFPVRVVPAVLLDE